MSVRLSRITAIASSGRLDVVSVDTARLSGDGTRAERGHRQSQEHGDGDLIAKQAGMFLINRACLERESTFSVSLLQRVALLHSHLEHVIK